MKSLKEWCAENQADELLLCYINGKNACPPEEVAFCSQKQYHWTCGTCGMSWNARCSAMIKRKGLPCNYCSHKKPSPFYNAAQLYPELQALWDDEQNKGKLEDYLPGSGYDAHWRCDRFHTWIRKISEQVKAADQRRKKPDDQRESLCPYCSNQRVSATYNLEIVCPEVARQWNYVKNGSLTPRDVTPYSQQKVFWVCSYNPAHVWVDRISNRTLLLRGCPSCSRQFRISYTARAVYYYLLTNHIACHCESSVWPYLIDILVEPLSTGDPPIALEIDGYYAHSRPDSVKRDAAKDAYLAEHGYRVIRVKDTPEKDAEMSFENDRLVYPYGARHEHLNDMIRCLIKQLSGLNVEPDHVRDHWKIEQLYYHDRKNRSLAVRYPDLAQEWSERNQDAPDVVSSGDGKNRWWRCPQCQKEYQASVYNRAKIGSGCPYCSHLKVREDTSLAAMYPEVAAQWDYEKNAPLRPEDVLPGTDKRVWWKCEKGHGWECLIYLRTGPKASKCPVCQRRKVIPETSLAAMDPQLAKWWHPEKNNIKLTEVAPFSNKLFWWRCEKGHEWQNSPDQLRKRDKDHLCPYCNHNRAWSEYCLETQNPKLASFWHPEKNAKTAGEVLPFSQKRAWWRCPKGHEWQANAGQMQDFAPEAYCPYCSNRRVWNENCLKTMAPQLAKQWHPTKNLPLTASDVFPWSSRKIWWQCEKGHEWQTTPAKRYRRHDGCPYCSGRRACAENCLAAKLPEVAGQWDQERNGALTPNDVTVRSARKVWWKCEKGHSWEASPDQRFLGRGCPICRKEKKKQ